MLCYVYANILEGAAKYGKVFSIEPVYLPDGKKAPTPKKAFEYSRPLAMELNIPCEDDFKNREQRCQKCKWNSPDECDYRYYLRAVWSSGDLENPPKVILGNRFAIDTNKLKTVYGDVIDKVNTSKTEITRNNEYTKCDLVINLKTELIDGAI